MSTDIFIPLKLLHHSSVLEAIKRGSQPVPILLQIVLSDLCNQDCNFCAYRTSGYPSNQHFGEVNKVTGIINNNPTRFLSKTKVKEILQDAKDIGVKAIEYTGGGEPLVHRDHKEIFQFTHELGLDFSLVTNGTLVTNSNKDILKESVWIRVSLDAGSAKTYSEIRRVSSDVYSRVTENIKKLVSLRQNKKPTIGISFVVLKENYTEILEAVKKAKDWGVDYIRLGAVFLNEGPHYYKDIFPQVQDETFKAMELSDPNFKVINQFNKRWEDLSQGNPDYSYCGHMQVNTYIAGDLSVYRCCALAYNDKGLIGSLEKKSFKELWFSSEKQENFDNFDARSCVRCPFNEKNRLINYIKKIDPLHVNFV